MAQYTTRPLLQDADPKGKLRSINENRIPLYSQANLKITVSESATSESIAQRVIQKIPNVIKTQNFYDSLTKN